MSAPSPQPDLLRRILIVDDHRLMCDGLRLLLQKLPHAEVVGACGDCATAWQKIGELHPDLVLMDIDLPDGSGIAFTRQLRAAFPAIKVVVLTAHAEKVFSDDAIKAGAHGYVEKTKATTELFTAVQTVLADGTYFPAPAPASSPPAEARRVLPAREGQVLRLLLRGLRNKEIAAELNLNVKTVETYRSRLMRRFHCATPAELVLHAMREGLSAL